VDTGDPTPPRSFEPSDLVGGLFAEHFRITRLASSGANTAIFDADDERSGRTVTLKLIRPRLASSPSFRKRFDDTMRAVSALSHPNIAALYDWGLARVGDTSTAYVVNEELTGGSLRDLFDRGRRLSPSQALAVGLDVCRALDHAHRRGFTHTEINPSKIVFGDDRRLRIVDFGLARLLAAPTWQRPDSVPTHVAWYAAPEQGLGLPVDGRADVYALCLSLHEAVTGEVPFKSDSTVASLTARVGKLMPVSADLGPLASVLERAGRPDADERSTAAEFGKALLQAASKLARPEPLPLLSSGLFDTPAARLRSPDDPTGGVYRPAPMPEAPLVIPVDEPDAGSDDATSEAAAEIEQPAMVADEPPLHDPVAGDELVILPLDAAVGSSPIAAQITEVAAHQVELAEAPESMPRRHRRFPWKVLLGLLVLAALVALVVLAMRLFERPSYPVPDLVGVSEAEARNQIAANGWEIQIETERSDDVPEVGDVVRTAPAAGVSLAEREPFLIVVSAGPLLRNLPELTGLTAADAGAALESLQLVGDPVDQNDETIPLGTVISWEVPGDATLVAGSGVEPGTPVRYVVSAGPAPRQVPNLIGRTQIDAQGQLEAVQLAYVLGDQVFSDNFPLGSVVSQSVAEGTEVARGTEIVVTISRGPDLIPFPDISSAATYEAAAQIVLQAGFQPVLVFGDAQGAVQSYAIDGDTPVVGDVYRRNSVVEFTAL
jgi:serine/threonine-protein kinase